MTRLHHLPALVVALALMLPSAAVLAQEEAEAPPAPTPVTVSADARIEDLRTMVPESLAGLPLREELHIATGEQLADQMSPDERAVFEDMLADQDRSLADYVAANAFLSIADSQVAVVQAHRVSGIEASETVGSWVEILGLNAQRPRVDEDVIDGRDVTLFSDDAQPDFPLLNLFASGDVVWMVIAQEPALVDEAVRVLAAASAPTDPAE